MDPKKFSEIKHYELPTYFKEHNWENTNFYEISYLHGEIIGDHNGFKKIDGINKPLGIIVSGQAELYETYIADKYRVYRPIRLVYAGDILGDFEVIDGICCEHNSLNSSRRGETWEICAGFISILIKQNASTVDHFQKNKKFYSPKEQHLVTHYHSNQETKIIFFDAVFIDKDSSILQELFLYSWPRSKMYRDCLNSFNFSQILDFRQRANLIADNMTHLKNGKQSVYDIETAKTSYLPFFIDAVWDVYNRPIRGEPMFAQASEEVLNEALKTFEEIGISPNNILVATADLSCNEFWFPIDINNYLIAANYDFSKKNHFEPEEIKHIQKKLENALKSIKKITTESNTTNKKSARTYYIDFCSELLKILNESHPNYPFDVTCEDVDGIEKNNKILMLRFTQKAT